MKREVFLSKDILLFKKWRSKGYAVFNTLGKEIKILALATVYFSVLGFEQTLAQVKTDSINRIINLHEVQVTARRAPSLYSEVGRVITVIPRQEILKLPVQSISELLRYAANVDVRMRGPKGVQADVSIRGGSFNQVMILLNGINVTDPQTGHFNLNLPVDLESIERIEILEGPGARVYGPSAFSGAINIITSDMREKKISAKAMAGQHCLYDVSLNSTLVSSKVKNYSSAGFGSSNGYIENTDFKTFHVFSNGRWHFPAGTMDIQVGYLNKSFGANAFYTPRFPDQFEHTETTLTSVKSVLGKRIKITPAFYWRRNTDRFELFRYESPGWYAGHNFHLTDVFGGSLNVVVPWSLGKTSLGGEVRRESIWSNNIGNDADNTKPVAGEPGEEYDKFYSRTNNSVFIEHVFSVRRFFVSVGLLLNNNSSLDKKLQLFPGMDMSYWFDKKIKVYASINKSLRMPTFTEMFYSGPVNEGNQYLKPEEAVTYEAGCTSFFDFMQNDLSVFYRHSWNLIDWGRMEDDEKYVSLNISEMNSFGLEFSTTVDMHKIFERQSFFQKVNLVYNYVKQDKEVIPGYESVYVLDYLRHKLYLGVGNRIISKLTSDFSLLFEDRNGTYVKYEENDTDGVLTEYEPFVTVDIRFKWSSGWYVAYLDIDNMFNKKYYDIGNVQQPGIWVTAGIKVYIRYK